MMDRSLSNHYRHIKVAKNLLETGKAYRCYCTTERLEELRSVQVSNKLPPRYDKCCRSIVEVYDRPYVIRLKVPDDLITLQVRDKVKGDVSLKADDLDDLIMLRSDSTPTYLLSVVVDDHDSGVTDVIRGDDHITNTFRQVLIYKACGWDIPTFSHIPLIHGPNGGKLSKRDGAVGVHEYKNLGYLPEAILLYLFSLGYGDKARYYEDMITRLDISKISRSPSRLDLQILNNINARIMKKETKILNIISLHTSFDGISIDMMSKALPELVSRTQTIVELISLFRNVYLRENALSLHNIDQEIKKFLSIIANGFDDNIFLNEQTLKEYIVNKVSESFQLSSVLDTGQASSPNIYRVMLVIGSTECIKRINL